MQPTRNHARNSNHHPRTPFYTPGEFFQSPEPLPSNYYDSGREVHSAPFGQGQDRSWASVAQSSTGPSRVASSQWTPSGLFQSHGNLRSSRSIQLPPTTSQHTVPSPFPHGGHRERIEGTVPAWLGNYEPYRGRHNPNEFTPPNYIHPSTPPSPPPIPAAYDRNRVPAWRENQISGSFRRSEADALVQLPDYVPVVRTRSPTSGPSSRGSGNSFSSGGASGGSARSHRDAVSRCEFCGREDLLSALKDHWLRCPRRNARRSSRPGIWFGGSRSVCLYRVLNSLSLTEYSYESLVTLRVVANLQVCIRDRHVSFQPRIFIASF